MPPNTSPVRGFATSALARAASSQAAPVTANGTPRTMDPLKKLADATKQCETTGLAYAQCVFATQFGNDSPAGVERDICKKEFMAFKNCVQEKTGRRW